MNETTEKGRVTRGPLASCSADGFNGMFRFVLCGEWIRCIASDGFGWQHVSVSREGGKQPPKWDIMCRVKDLFFGEDEWVMQFHPAKKDYVNNHAGCLHLWKPTGQTFPRPEAHLVGIKDMKPSEYESLSDAEKLRIFKSANAIP